MSKDRTLERFKIIDQTEFTWKDRRYKIDQIEHLSFEWVNVTERVYGAKAGEYQRACIHIGLLNNQRLDICLTEKPSFAGMSIPGLKNEKSESIEEMKSLFGTLRQLSFQTRLSNYMRTLDSDGFMRYGKCRFYPKEQVIYYKNKPFPIPRTKFERYQDSIVMAPATGSRFLKVAVFDASNDQDILFAVLCKWFGIGCADQQKDVEH